ncbi:MAG TPA: ATP-grasp domain-containing protein [Kofleriaceae bacterium]
MISVGITGIHLGENAQPGPGVARSLREALGADVRLVGLAYDVFDSGLYAGVFDDAFLLPYPSAGPAAYGARLREVQALAGLDVLIPNLDVELPVLARLAPELRAAGIRTVLPSADALARRTKDRLPVLAGDLEIAVPSTVTITDRAGLARAGDALGFPLVVKGPFYEAEVAHSPGEAAAAFDRLAARWGLPLLAQQFIAGEEFDVIALGDGTRAHGAVAMRKTVLTKAGKAWGAVTIRDPELLAVADRTVEILGWRGGLELELLRAKSDGTLYLIEINPRFPAWVYLATCAGVNLPLGALRLALGEPLPDYGDYRAGVFHVRHASEVIGDLSDLETLMTTGRIAR